MRTSQNHSANGDSLEKHPYLICNPTSNESFNPGTKVKWKRQWNTQLLDINVLVDKFFSVFPTLTPRFFGTVGIFTSLWNGNDPNISLLMFCTKHSIVKTRGHLRGTEVKEMQTGLEYRLPYPHQFLFPFYFITGSVDTAHLLLKITFYFLYEPCFLKILCNWQTFLNILSLKMYT